MTWDYIEETNQVRHSIGVDGEFYNQDTYELNDHGYGVLDAVAQALVKNPSNADILKKRIEVWEQAQKVVSSTQ